jgi:hypothetical protein
METIGQQTMRSFDAKGQMVAMKCIAVRKGPGLFVENFRDLAARIAELQFRNRDFVLFFRGQSMDHKNQQGNSTLRPSILRRSSNLEKASEAEVRRRFERLANCEVQLIDHMDQFVSDRETRTRLRRERILRWSVLQHYEVCCTPLLDVTHSLRVAASFASAGANDQAFVYALGLPNLSGAITASVEAGLQIVRLASVCPALAVRPHIQEGYLLGEYPEVSTPDQNGLYEGYELDFGRRLVAKFCFDPRTFWKDPEFPQIGHAALYPSNDPLARALACINPSRKLTGTS